MFKRLAATVILTHAHKNRVTVAVHRLECVHCYAYTSHIITVCPSCIVGIIIVMMSS